MMQHRLLIVDDEPGITRLIEILARSVGIESLAINDPLQFEMAVGSVKPTIIFLDIVMPGRDGTELISQLAAGNYPGKLVLMSGADPTYMQMAAKLGSSQGLMIVAHLPKPFRNKQILNLLSQLDSGL
jgi:CheY-like chemotaxis protein